MTDRKRDEHGRAFYADHEIPPPTEQFAHWRGRLTVGNPPSAGTTTTMHRDHRTGRDTCIDGWVLSGEWWLHCGFCRPYAAASPPPETQP